jgi:hypothetical protein
MEEGGDINTRKEEEGVEMERKGGGYAQYLFLSVGANVAGGGSGCNGVWRTLPGYGADTYCMHFSAAAPASAPAR